MAAVIDCMPVRTDTPTVVRVVEGKRGRVAMSLDLVLRLDYGSLIPWVHRTPDGIWPIGGASALRLRTPVAVRGERCHTVADFTVAAGQRVPFTLGWSPSCGPEPSAVEPDAAIETTAQWWQRWSEPCAYDGEWREAVVRSLITLKALTSATSVPERLGGVRNWDESAWREPDEGSGPRRLFTHSKVMAWVALDRAVKAVQRFGLEGPTERWRAVRAAIHDDVCRNGFDPGLGAFVQYYGSKLLDASLLMIPLVGFLPATDPRMLGTVEAIRQHLTSDGLVARYQTAPELDGLPPGEGDFLA